MSAITDTSPAGPAAGRYDYTTITKREVSAWLRQYRAAGDKDIRCEFGHQFCGCSNSLNMDGLAPCYLAAMAALTRLNS